MHFDRVLSVESDVDLYVPIVDPKIVLFFNNLAIHLNKPFQRSFIGPKPGQFKEIDD